MEDTRILEKIKKLLKLSASNNQNESSLALEKALELMNKHGISDSRLRMSDVTEAQSKQMRVLKLADYQIFLLNAIQDLFGCESFCIYDFNHKLKRWVVRPVFVGLGANAEVAAYCFEVLSIKQDKARIEFLGSLHKNTKKQNKTNKANEFAIGWAIGINETVKRLVPVRVVPEVVDEYFKLKTKNMADTITRKSKTSKDNKALIFGLDAGSKVDISKPISGNKIQVQLSY